MQSETPVQPGPSPFLAIWFAPRPTITRIVDDDPTQHVLLLAALAGLSNGLSIASNNNLGDYLPFWAVLLVCLVGGPLFGILALYLGGWVVEWVGSALGGQAGNQKIRAALAWSTLPLAAGLPLWSLQIPLIREELFTSATPRLLASPPLALLLGFAGLLGILLSLWMVFLMVSTLSEVQRFAAWKAALSLLVAALVGLSPSLCIWILRVLYL